MKKQVDASSYTTSRGTTRVCLGASFAMMEMMAGLATLLNAIRFHLHDTTTPEPMHRITLRPRNAIVLRLEPRP